MGIADVQTCTGCSDGDSRNCIRYTYPWIDEKLNTSYFVECKNNDTYTKAIVSANTMIYFAILFIIISYFYAVARKTLAIGQPQCLLVLILLYLPSTSLNLLSENRLSITV